MRWRSLLVLSLLLNGCAAAVAVSAIPGVLVDRAVSFFSGQEASLPVGMQQALVGVQQGLGQMGLQVDVLEPVEEGYAVEFGNGELDGDILLKRQTKSLTTLTVSAHRGLTHEASVERAIVKEIRQATEQMNNDASFDFQGYRKIYVRPDSGKRYVGWFRPGAMLHVTKSNHPGWLKIKLPSGQAGYVRANLSHVGT
ncbi:MAG: SH3 domain-containing protein [Mariprofundaceae bacterium]|nr:SH3 domain-containing protein [Mariprofundaceae bacterium]